MIGPHQLHVVHTTPHQTPFGNAFGLQLSLFIHVYTFAKAIFIQYQVSRTSMM